MRRAVIGVLGLAPVAACLFPSTGDLGGPDASGFEAGVEAGDDAGQDAAVDVDAAVEASAPFCANAGTHSFCSDFDEQNALAAWSAALVSANATTPGLDTDAVSPPSSLRSVLPDATSADSYARLQKLFSTQATSAHVDLQVKLGSKACTASDGNSYFELLKIGDNLDDGVEIKVDSTGWYAHVDFALNDAGTTQADQYFSATPSVDVWHRVVVDVTFGVAGSVHITVDGPGVVDLPNVDTSSVDSASFLVGMYSTGSCPANDVRFDDVVIDVTP